MVVITPITQSPEHRALPGIADVFFAAVVL